MAGARGSCACARMDVQAVCEVTHDFTGAMAVSIFFLVVFVALLVADGVLTYYALRRAIERDPIREAERRETISELDKTIEIRTTELARLNSMIVQQAVPMDTAASYRGDLSSCSIRLTPR